MKLQELYFHNIYLIKNSDETMQNSVDEEYFPKTIFQIK